MSTGKSATHRIGTLVLAFGLFTGYFRLAAPARADCVLTGTPECNDSQVDDLGFAAALSNYGITFPSRQAGLRAGTQICTWLDFYNARTPSKVLDNVAATYPALSPTDDNNLIQVSIKTFCPIY
jgi:hypothetical protein